MTKDEDLWSDEICALVDAAFETVSRNPSDHEEAFAYRRAIAAAIDQQEDLATALRATAAACADHLKTIVQLREQIAILRQPTQGYGVVTAANYTSPIGGAGTGLQTVVIRKGMAACTDRIGGACVVTHGVVGVAKDPAAEWQAGYEAGVEAAAKALEDDAKLCDCAALEERECACGAWDDYKSITSARAVEIVRKLIDTK